MPATASVTASDPGPDNHFAFSQVNHRIIIRLRVGACPFKVRMGPPTSPGGPLQRAFTTRELRLLVPVTSLNHVTPGHWQFQRKPGALAQNRLLPNSANLPWLDRLVAGFNKHR